MVNYTTSAAIDFDVGKFLCARDESRRTKKVITGNHFSCTTLCTPSLLFQASWVSLTFPSNVSHRS